MEAKYIEFKISDDSGHHLDICITGACVADLSLFAAEEVALKLNTAISKMRAMKRENDRLTAEAKQREEFEVNAKIPVDRTSRILSTGESVSNLLDHTEIQANGQQKGYVVLTAEERAKGFVRPLRFSYRHVGPFAAGSERRIGGCNTVTSMSQPIAETYARDPGFYDGTFCSSCRKHFVLNEFVWDDGTNQQVGS